MIECLIIYLHKKHNKISWRRSVADPQRSTAKSTALTDRRRRQRQRSTQHWNLKASSTLTSSTTTHQNLLKMAASTKQQGSFKFPDICIVDTDTTTNSLVNEHSSLLKSASVSGGSMSSCNYTAICIPSEQPSLSTSSSSSSLSSMGSKKSKKGDIWFSIYLLFYISYLVLGSVAFQSMEVNTEIMMRQNFRDARQTFLQKYSNVMGK